ncbi:acyclic terpene utilization AtuA family protein [Sphingomonas sp. 2SG]|uniref:acyclic terpene utilization AtuA family protein n=1 Tax=Sphingomonas sp. 2SG TaxID=2502201 RepID=UPI001BB1CC9C|nr:acyclic terpene utilization AtuA family protein [Sphingomonas sp. 2SG]
MTDIPKGYATSPTINVIVPTGALGAGVRDADVRAGLAMGGHVIACDAGSTDSGPAYLATGRPKYSRAAVKADLAILMQAQHDSGLPLLIGSCGTSGCDMALDWTAQIASEIAAERGLSPQIALLYSEQDAAVLDQKASQGKVGALAPMNGVPPAFADCDHIVALMGSEPYIAALEAGANIVLGGRTTDTAVIAAVPLMRGMGAGAAWHAGKIAECGGLCTRNSRDGGVIVRVGSDVFEVEPLSATNTCDPYTVSAHMLYENADPFRLAEPGGVLDVTAACYEATNARTVRVTGSVFERQPYTMKLEGASAGAFQTIMFVGIRDPKVVAEIDALIERMHGLMCQRVADTMGLALDAFSISLRPYGWSAVSGQPPADAPPPPEVGLMFVATAATQDVATQVAKTCNPIFFHMPLRMDQEMPSYAFPFSPAEIERGPVYEFRLNHVVAPDDPLELVRMRFLKDGRILA